MLTSTQQAALTAELEAGMPEMQRFLSKSKTRKRIKAGCVLVVVTAEARGILKMPHLSCVPFEYLINYLCRFYPGYREYERPPSDQGILLHVLGGNMLLTTIQPTLCHCGNDKSCPHRVTLSPDLLEGGPLN